MAVLVMGSIALDVIRMPDGREYKGVLGGSCSYFARASAMLAKTRVVGVVGGDFGARDLAYFKHPNIDTAGLRVIADGKTFRWTGTYAAGMNERTTDDLFFGVLGDFAPQVPSQYRDTPAVFLACATPAAQAAVLAQVNKPELVVGDTIEVYIQNDRAALDRVFKRCDGVIVNDSEARLLLDESNLARCASALLRRYNLRFAVVKKGEHGVLLAVRGEGVYPFPAIPLEKVADPTGAGDAFAGGFMGYLAKARVYDSRHFRRACAHGIVLATYACESVGPAALNRATPALVRARVAEYARRLRLP